MARRKKVDTADIKVEFDEIGTGYADSYAKNEIPQGATHYELEVDYSGCYYEGDTPSYIVHFFKKISK